MFAGSLKLVLPSEQELGRILKTNKQNPKMTFRKKKKSQQANNEGRRMENSFLGRVSIEEDGKCSFGDLLRESTLKKCRFSTLPDLFSELISKRVLYGKG